MSASRTWGREEWLGLALVCACNAALLWFFHNRYWYPTDDGFYAHIAERLLAGEILNRDVQDIHPGYIHVVHVVAFKLFGIDLLSLRYPLIAAAFIQAIVTFALLRQRGLLLAIVGSIATTGVGVVQFMSPNGNWYCLALAIVLAWWLTVVPHGPVRLVGAGVILGTLTWFRHLTGIWVAMAVIALVLMERSRDALGRQQALMRLQVAIMLAALVTYLYWSPDTEIGGLLFMGVWPAAVFVWMLFNTRTHNRDVLAAVGQVLVGCLLASAPLLLYHLAHGSLAAFVYDAIIVAASETDLAFYGNGWYGVLPLAGFYQATSSLDPVRVVNGLYWTVLPVVSALNGMLVLRALRNGVDTRMLALPVIAVFYGVVAVQYEGPLYLYYIVGLSLISVLWLASTSGPSLSRLSVSLAAALCAVAVIFHAGQTRERTPIQILTGERVTRFATLVDCGLPRCSLKVSASDAEIYGNYARLIAHETTEKESILAIPNDAELYFLTGRTNPTRFYNAAQGTASEELRREALRVLEQEPPRLVIFRPADKYNNHATRDLMTTVRTRYTFLGEHHGVEVYRR